MGLDRLLHKIEDKVGEVLDHIKDSEEERPQQHQGGSSSQAHSGGGEHHGGPQQQQQQGQQQQPQQQQQQHQQNQPNTDHRFQSFSPISSGAVKWHVDGASYFWAVSLALEEAKDHIYILDWWLSPELYLRRPPSRNEKYRLDNMLRAAAEGGVQIRVIVYKEVKQALTLDSEHTRIWLEKLHPNIKVFRHPDHIPNVNDAKVDIASTFEKLHMGTVNAFDLSKVSTDALKSLYGSAGEMVLYWAHHEKLCVVDGRVAFMGGLDMCFGRWDTNSHPIADAHPGNLDSIVFPGQDYNNARVFDFEGVSNWDHNQLDRTRSSRMGWSDISISLQGQIVSNLTDHFVDRWNFIFSTKYKEKNPGKYQIIPPAHGPPSQGHGNFSLENMEDRFDRGVSRVMHERGGGHERGANQQQRGGPGHNLSIQLCRSCTEWSAGHPTEHSIANAYIQAISDAEHFVYIENQFFITATGDDQKPVGNRIGQAIVERIVRAHNDGREFRVICAMPAVPAFAGDLHADSALGTRAIMEYQYNSINRGGKSIMERLQQHGIDDPRRYITFYNLRNYDRINCSSTMSQAENRSGIKYETARREHDELVANDEMLSGPRRGDYGGQHGRPQHGRQGNDDFSGGGNYPVHLGGYDDRSEPHQRSRGAYDDDRAGGDGYSSHGGGYGDRSEHQQSGRREFDHNDAGADYNTGREGVYGDSFGRQQPSRQDDDYNNSRADYNRGREDTYGENYGRDQRSRREYGDGSGAGGYSSRDDGGYGGRSEHHQRPRRDDDYDSGNYSSHQESHSHRSEYHQSSRQEYSSHSHEERSEGRYGEHYERYQNAAKAIPDQTWDSIAACYMYEGPDLNRLPWQGSPESEMDAFVSEELYIHSKVLIADDRLVICGSANLNDRSQLGTHDSEIAVVIEDKDHVDSRMNGRSFQAARFATSLRRQLFRKHLGILPHQAPDKPDKNWTPVNHDAQQYDWGSPADRLVEDPMSRDFWQLWTSTARTNTEVFSRAFHPVPNDHVRNWNQYESFFSEHFIIPTASKDDKGKEDQEREERKQREKGKVDYGHVVRSEFPGGVQELKQWLGRIRGTLVEMPLDFLIEVENLAKEGLSLNTFTDELYT